MSDGTLASAVALPEQGISNQSQEHTAKRRNSSITDNDSKRRRLSADGNVSPHSERQQPSQSPTVERERPRNRRPAQQTGREDERKRGRRLFGGLLGTLSQSSTSAAQKRRADIEKRQQDKLKNQAEEYDGMRSRKKEFREVIRRKETPFYEREAMQTRHSNMIAAAHFLKTRTEPVLCYKPWQLRTRDEEIIAEQIKEAEAKVSREVAEFEARYPPEAFVYQPTPEMENGQPAEQRESQQKQQPPLDGENQETTESKEEDTSATREDDTVKEAPGATTDIQNTQPPSDTSNVDAQTTQEVVEANRAADDDGGEVVEDNEDTVIY
ncbi:hypothetical protein N7450_010577 [Penicillium hetheringtonii]|uniref:Pinin/SDK/MemA protein domain-containing protein n=1 Tax=Penicillium hetheringtonii TaxID=911720 RepID=A0AAD6D889_9EURO|nr:hypothetical protein N7450_010577 [Penicillium hetheringtonii]